MKPKAFFLVAAVFALILSGCGGGDHRPSIIVQDIVSEGGVNDGDITNAAGFFTVFTSNVSPNTILVDFNPPIESRGFITFSLATIPVTASIQSATVFLPILRAAPVLGSPSVTLFPDMVTFPPLNPLASQPTIASIFNTPVILQGPSFAVFPGDAGSDRTFDATNAVIEANRPPALPTLQIRLISGGGQVEIDDLLDPVTGAGTPLLRVEYL